MIKIKYAILFKILLDLFYPISTKYFSYMWKTTYNIDYVRILVSYFLIYFSAKIVYRKNNKYISTEMLEILYTLIAIPVSTIYSFNNEKLFYFILVITIFSVLSKLLRFFLKNYKFKKLKNRKQIILKNKQIINYMIVIIIMVIIIASIQNRPNINSFNMYKIYKIRSTNNLNIFLRYAIPFQVFFMIPYTLLNSLKYRNLIKIVFIISLQLLTYSIFPHKIYLIVLILIILIYFSKNISLTVLKINCFLVMLGLLVKNILIIAIVDRAYTVPAILNYQYYNYFLKNDYNYFSGSKLGIIFFNMNNGIELSQRMSKVLYNSSMNPNTGFIASSYGELGILGVVIICFLLFVTLLLIDIIIDKKNKKIAKSVLFFPVICLVNGQLITIYLTQGLLLIIIYYFFIKQK